MESLASDSAEGPDKNLKMPGVKSSGGNGFGGRQYASGEASDEETIPLQAVSVPAGENLEAVTVSSVTSSRMSEEVVFETPPRFFRTNSPESDSSEPAVMFKPRFMDLDRNTEQLLDSEISDIDDLLQMTDRNKLLHHSGEHGDTEGTVSFLVQFLIPFFMAGLGQLLAGLILDKIQHWKSIQFIPNTYILIPALLGLKGNCEMCLAARLSTQANVNSSESANKFFSFILSNLGIVQVHSICIGFLAAVGANTLGWIPEGKFNLNKSILLTASCLFTASMTSLVLGSVMIVVIFISKLCRINPDNIATPIAASLGDLTTVFILANTTALLIEYEPTLPWLPLTVAVLCFAAVPFWWRLAIRNPAAKESLLTGWQPVVIAMVISSVGGLIMEYSILNFRGIAVYQLIVNGVAGNLVAVQASKLSTYLHLNYNLGADVPFSYDVRKIFFGPGPHAHTARILLFMVIPGHLVFNYAVASLKAGHTSATLSFMVTYLTTSFIQVAILLYICHILIHKMWHRGVNPDNSAIPYLTAIADFLGMIFLSIAFEFLYHIGDRDDDIGD